MTVPPDDDRDAPLDFDPYRFGRPEHPIAPEYAPPGYVPPAPATPPGQAPTAYPPPAVWPPTEQSGGHQQGGYSGYQGYQQAYPPPGYARPGYPPPPPGYPGYGAPAGNTKATLALVLGILSVVLCFFSIFDLVLIVPAVVLGVLGRRDAVRDPRRGGKTTATIGLVCGALAVVLAVSVTVYAYNRIKPCVSQYDTTSTAYNQCVRDRLLGD